MPAPRGKQARAYPPPLDPDDPTGDSVVLAATRALLSVESRAEAARVLHTAINDLGGGVVPARLADHDTIPIDVSLGEGEPRVVVVDPLSSAAMRLAHHLPLLAQDALVAAARCESARRQALSASVDTLTGVATRAEIGPRLGRAGVGDVVCLLDLDGFKQLNDTYGHAAGDEELRAFGALLRGSVRGADFCGRYGGDEFVVVLARTPLDAARSRMAWVAAEWERRSTRGTTVSIGVALVGPGGAGVASRAADGAMYRAKRLGRNRVEVAEPGDYEGHA